MRSQSTLAALGAVRLKRSVAWCIGVLVAAGLVLPTGTGMARSGASGLQACPLLIASGPPGVPPRPDEPILNSCVDGHCFSHYTDSSGQKRCAYARGASLRLQCAGTPGGAAAFVRTQLQRGFRRVNLGADIAGLVSSSKGASVVLAVNRAIVLFNEGASSDDNPHPVFPGVRQDVIKGGRRIAAALRKSRRVC